MNTLSKIKELALILCVLLLMNGIASYAASATVALYADQKSASSASFPVPDDDKLTVWGSVSSASKYRVQFVVPDSILRHAFDRYCGTGGTISPEECYAFNVSATNLYLYGNSKDDQKKDCIASGGVSY